MKTFLPLLLVVIIVSACSVPTTQTSLNYQGPNAYNKMLLALSELAWEISFSEKDSGIISAKKLLGLEAMTAEIANTTAYYHIATIKIDNDVINITISQPGNASPFGADQYQVNDLKKELIAKFESYGS